MPKPPTQNRAISSDDFQPTATWDRLRLRARLLAELRQFFDQRCFLEVTTPLLSADTVVDRHLDPLRVTLFSNPRYPRRGRKLYLQTSPEFHMKRLLACGAKAVYQVTHAFRGGEEGDLHNVEFTIAEWYRAGDTMEEGIALLDQLCDALLRRGSALRLSYREAFERYVGIDPHRADTSELAEVLSSLDPTYRPGIEEDDRDSLLNLLLSLRIQPHLGRDRPVILFHYPASQAMLAQIRNGSSPVAERFELFVDGVELANGYHELTDPKELRRRNRLVNRQRRLDGKPALPARSRLLRAMEHGLPSCTGTALGFDRLAMIHAGATSLQEVIPFPMDRA